MKSGHNLRRWFRAVVGAALLMTVCGPVARGQQQQQGVCAQVKIEILQELTLERIGFLATLEITNNDSEDPITEFSAGLTFEDPALSEEGAVHDASDLFFVRAPELENISAVDGGGVIQPGEKAVISWFIIPKIQAGGTSPEGVRYFVGAQLAAKHKGVQIPNDVLLVIPDQIYVKPEPQLEITYFQPRDVQGDDPFTTEVESPIPFTLGVLVKNSGFGMARKVKIDSQQPKIVENKQNLLLIARLLGARVNDSPLRTANLLVDLGDIPPGATAKGAWDMITSLSGEFVEFKASYKHASELGGEDTSVITSLEAHFIAHEVLNDQAGRDDILDFLADTDRDPNQIPDALYESQGNILPVNHLQEAEVTGGGNSFTVELVADKEGWGYMRLNDPGQARLPIEQVVRSDGKVLNPNNVWTNVRYEKVTNHRLSYLNILDLVDLGEYTYTVTYQPSVEDNTPPETTLRFAGDVSETGGRFYITPETQLFFLSEDESPVSIFYKLNDEPFVPALPFQLRDSGVYAITYYAEDRSGNREADRQAVVVVSVEPPGLAEVSLDGSPLFVSGDALSVRPDSATLRFNLPESPLPVDATLDIFEGAVGWVRVGGVPSSQTGDRNASLEIGGENVDFYKYQLDGGQWSGEMPVVQPLVLEDLSAGRHTLLVLGRSRHGHYLSEDRAVSVSWVVEPTAPPTRVTGAPATPTRSRSATLGVGGEGVTHYRWSLANSYFRPEAPVEEALSLEQLPEGEVRIRVIGKVGGEYQPEERPTTVEWLVDPDYGSDFSMLSQVVHAEQEGLGGGEHQFEWHGLNDNGAAVRPGWYTMRLTLSDQLGRKHYEVRLIQVGDVTGTESLLVDQLRGPRRPYGRGAWAVWQDQSEGRWQIYGQRLDGGHVATRLSMDGQNQERPKTDGNYVVWQGRQENGNWDVLVRKLDPPGEILNISNSPNFDETKPAVDWPWIVFQARQSGNEDDHWQVRAFNMATRNLFEIWSGPQDQIDADVHAGRAVWQDHRDVGPGEIYLAHLETGERQRLTTSTFGQLHPVVRGSWVVWEDNRDGQLELYGYDLLRRMEVRLTESPENESRPYMEGDWLVVEEDALGPDSANLRLMHLETARSLPLTRSRSMKQGPSLAGGHLVWENRTGNAVEVKTALLPAVQAVFENQNMVAVTDAMIEFHGSAYSLLRAWNEAAGVTAVTRYSSLVPEVVTETASVGEDGEVTGADFALAGGTFLWVKFHEGRILDLGVAGNASVDLAPGPNVFSYTGFPAGYSAYRLLRQIGLDRARAVRMLDSGSGQWQVAEVMDNRVVGVDFAIPPVSVVMLELMEGVAEWRPE